MSRSVAPDGSPVDVYLALPAGDIPDIIHSAVKSGGTILELGSGPGRVTHPLLNLGYAVVAVDEHQPMLDEIQAAETVLGDVFTLRLDRTFDAVIAGSHLINSSDRGRRRMLLDVCHRHVNADGVVLVERYDPVWASNPPPSDTQIGSVQVSFRPIEVRESSFDATVTYTLTGRQWNQSFSAAAVTNRMLRMEAVSAGLKLTAWLTDDQTWALLKRA